MRLLLRLTTLALVLLALHVVGVVEIQRPAAARAVAEDAKVRAQEWVQEGMPLPLPEGWGPQSPPPSP